MKRAILITLVVAATLWITYAGYELFFKNDREIAPANMFCSLDEGVLLINRIKEVKSADYLSVIEENEFAPSLGSMDSLFKKYPSIKVFASKRRNLVILDNPEYWKRKDSEFIKGYFPLSGIEIKVAGPYILLTKDIETCNQSEELEIFEDADKKASANYWEYNDQFGWKRTDVYNLEKGFFEYISSDPGTTYGKAVDELTIFASVLPTNLSNYAFHERFYAVARDSIFRNGPMSTWVDMGYVSFNYREHQVICSDYRSKQQPRLILVEKSTKDDSIAIDNEINSFEGFRLTEQFPSSDKERFFTMEIEDKVFFATSKSVLQQLKIDYQLGKTIALQPEHKEELFGGLPTFTNYRFVGADKKMSLTWKKNLLFEVNTKPPKEQLNERERDTWSYAPDFKVASITPIPDHLRKGTSAMIFGELGNYELIGPNGNQIWKGSINEKIIGKVEVVDVFDNDKHQFLLKTEKSVHLIDLNGNEVGGFPYKSESKLTSEISSFVWNGTKRFLVGTEKGEVIMLNSSGRELTIIQLTNKPIINSPLALNIRGNLRAWGLDQDGNQFLGYLETPAKAEKLEKTSAKYFAKHKGTVLGYYLKEGEIYQQSIEKPEGKLIEKGSILFVDDNGIIVKNESTISTIGHNGSLTLSINAPFNEVSSTSTIEVNENTYLLIMDYLKNKIYLFDQIGNIVEGFPKEGRNRAMIHANAMTDRQSVYTLIENSIVCYKINL